MYKYIHNFAHCDTYIFYKGSWNRADSNSTAAQSDYAVVNFLVQNVLSYSEVIAISGNSADIRQKYLGQISILFEDPLYTQTNDDDFHCLKGQDLLDSIDCAMQAYTHTQM